MNWGYSLPKQIRKPLSNFKNLKYFKNSSGYIFHYLFTSSTTTAKRLLRPITGQAIRYDAES